MKMVFDADREEWLGADDSMPWIVEQVVPREDYTLSLSFSDGTSGRYDARELFELPCLASLKDLDIFMQAHVKADTVGWPGDLDVAPEHLYEMVREGHCAYCCS